MLKIISVILLVMFFPITLIAEENKYEIQNRYFKENYSFSSKETIGTSLLFIYKNIKDIIFYTQITYQDKFKNNESLQEIGGSYKFNDKIALRESLGYSSDKWTFPKSFIDTDLTYNLASKNVLNFGYKLNIFNDANVRIYYLSSTNYSLSKATFQLKIFHAITDFDVNSLSESNNSYLLKMDYFFNQTHELIFNYISDTQSYLNREELGKFKADTFGVNWNINIKESLWLTTDISYQKRKEPISAEQKTIGIGFIKKW